MVVNFTLDEISKAASDFVQIIGTHKVVALHGEMGAGKTTFVQAVCTLLGITGTVSSPTFSIINEYKTTSGNLIFHMDLYRLANEKEAVAAGVEDSLYSGALCLVEWPDKAPGIFPETTIHCYLTVTGDNSRKLQINL